MGRPNKGESFIGYLEEQIRKGLDKDELTGAERASLINSGIKLVDIRSSAPKGDEANFFHPKDKG